MNGAQPSRQIPAGAAEEGKLTAIRGGLAEEEAFHPDQKQVGCAHAELRQEALSAGETAEANARRRRVYSKEVQE